MTFDLTPSQLAAQSRARELAATLDEAAATDIDTTAELPPAIGDALEGLAFTELDTLTRLLVIEEIAAVSAGVAARLLFGTAGERHALAGLGGVRTIGAPDEAQHLDLAAVCLGLGRSALNEALSTARARGDRPGGESADPPYWALADAATELDAARLLVQAAAAAGPGALPEAACLVRAANAAVQTVDAALRIVGPEGYAPGARLERCARDARAAWLVVGGEDAARRVASDALFEHRQ